MVVEEEGISSSSEADSDCEEGAAVTSMVRRAISASRSAIKQWCNGFGGGWNNTESSVCVAMSFGGARSVCTLTDFVARGSPVRGLDNSSSACAFMAFVARRGESKRRGGVLTMFYFVNLIVYS